MFLKSEKKKEDKNKQHWSTAGAVTKLKKESNGQSILLDKIKAVHSYKSFDLRIHPMNLFSCIINTLKESSTLAG